MRRAVILFALCCCGGSLFGGTWSYAPWTDDAGSGIGSNHSYTCAVNINGAAVTVNGVPFEAYPGTSGTGWRIGGNVSIHGSRSSNVSGDGAALADDGFAYGGTPRTVTLSGLISGRRYITTFFAFAWDSASTRVQTFASGSDSAVIDQNEYGLDNGIRVDYRFVATGDTQLFTITPRDSGQTFHLSALANRETLGESFVAITNATTTVGAEVTHYSVGGTKSSDITGTMVWSNAATLANGAFPASTSWQVTDIALAIGDNTISVSGTNLFGDTRGDAITVTRSPFLSGHTHCVDITDTNTTVGAQTVSYAVNGTNCPSIVGTMT